VRAGDEKSGEFGYNDNDRKILERKMESDE
jgi:hypothetical protein